MTKRQAQLIDLLRQLVAAQNAYVDCMHVEDSLPHECVACQARVLLAEEDASRRPWRRWWRRGRDAS